MNDVLLPTPPQHMPEMQLCRTSCIVKVPYLVHSMKDNCKEFENCGDDICMDYNENGLRFCN
jgi:hypothetical protein